MRALALVLLASPALAQMTDYVAADGTVFRAAPASGGVALTPLGGAAGALVLLPDCSANDERATGTWGQANGGFLVSLADRTIGFPRQELTELTSLPATDCPLE